MQTKVTPLPTPQWILFGQALYRIEIQPYDLCNFSFVGFSSVFRKLVCISLLLFTSFYLLPYLLVHEDAYSEQQLYEDLNACDDNRVYKGYTHPCDIQGVDKDSFERVLKKRASTDGKILLMMVDRGSLDFSINLYLTSLVKQGLRNYLFVSVDKSTCVELLRRNISCHVYREDRDAGHDSVYYSKDFLRKMNYRTFIILDALKLGYTVLHSDVDMFFYKNPFDEISCEWKACDMAMLNDYNMAKRISTFNAGKIWVVFFFVDFFFVTLFKRNFIMCF